MSPPAPVSALVGIRLRMAVRADQPQVLNIVIHWVAVLMVHLKRRGPAHPLGYAADFAAMASLFKQVPLY